jgi:hypothetical protein
MVKNLITKHDDTFQRIFEVIPGLLIWLLLTAPVWLGKALPDVAADLVVVLTIYWVYKAAEMTIGAIVGYIKYRKDSKTDWLVKLQGLAFANLPGQNTLPQSSRFPKHLIVIPNGGARYDILQPTLANLRAQNYPKELIYISISTEERLIEKDPAYFTEMHNQIKTEFADFGDRLMLTIHPKDLPGEVKGAASNRTWGVKTAVETLEQRGELIDDFLVTSPDEDLHFHPQFLAAISYEYMIAPKRRQKFFQTAVYTFNNNYWEVPLLVRTFAAGVTLPVLSSSAINETKRETWSCYTINLGVMKAVNYWDTSIGIDDTPYFWRPYFYFHGDFECRVFFIPLSADAVYHPNYLSNHRAQYKQLLRWGWGVLTFPIAIKGLLTHQEVPLYKKIGKIINLFEVFVLWKVMAFLITFAAPIIFLVSNQYNELVISHTLPNTLSVILMLATVFLIPSTIVKILLAPPPPPNRPLIHTIAIILIEVPLNLVVLMTYSFLPFIEASTRMMLGQKYGFAITAKHTAKN